MIGKDDTVWILNQTPFLRFGHHPSAKVCPGKMKSLRGRKKQESGNLESCTICSPIMHWLCACEQVIPVLSFLT